VTAAHLKNNFFFIGAIVGLVVVAITAGSSRVSRSRFTVCPFPQALMTSEVLEPSNAAGGGERPQSRRQKSYSKRTDRKGRALTLAQEIKRLQEREEFAEFKGELEKAIRRVRFTGNRSESSDRNLVVDVLETCDRMGVGASVADIVADTTLEKPAVQTILDELVMSDVVEMYERPEKKRGPKVMLYKLLRGKRADVANSPAARALPRSEDFEAPAGLRRVA
jgi:hypothetical protein